MSKVGALKSTVGLAGALLGVAAVGAAAGAVVEHYTLGRVRRKPDDPYADEPFGLLPADAELTVTTEDGVPLHVEIVEPAGDGPPELTVVFVHGFALDMGTWHFQRSALQHDDTGPRCRLVFYDQPGHGKSGTRDNGDYTIDQLGADLAAIVSEVAPEGPLVLVGHSMGGMTIMALAERDPDLIAERVVGIGLISTSAGHLDDVALGMPPILSWARKPLTPMVSGALKWQPGLAELGRKVGNGSDLTYLLTRRYGFGSQDPSPALVEYVERMNSATSVEVFAGYLGTLSEHDRYAALEAFDGIETLIVCGEKDLFTPVQHTREIAELLPGAELVEVVSGGHLTLMEHSTVVNAQIFAFLRRAARTAAAGIPARPFSTGRAAIERRKKAAESGPTERRKLRDIIRRKGA